MSHIVMVIVIGQDTKTVSLVVSVNHRNQARKGNQHRIHEGDKWRLKLFALIVIRNRNSSVGVTALRRTAISVDWFRSMILKQRKKNS